MSDKPIKVMKERDMERLSGLQRVGKGTVTIGLYAFLLIMALIVLFPFYWMIISSLKTLEEYKRTIPTFWPQKIMISNYAKAFTTANLGTLFVNTMIVGVVSTVLSLVITVLSALSVWSLMHPILWKASPSLPTTILWARKEKWFALILCITVCGTLAVTPSSAVPTISM